MALTGEVLLDIVRYTERRYVISEVNGLYELKKDKHWIATGSFMAMRSILDSAVKDALQLYLLNHSENKQSAADYKLIPQMMTCEVTFIQNNDPLGARSTMSFMINGSDDPIVQSRLKTLAKDKPGIKITGLTFSDMYKVQL